MHIWILHVWWWCLHFCWFPSSLCWGSINREERSFPSNRRVSCKYWKYCRKPIQCRFACSYHQLAFVMFCLQCSIISHRFLAKFAILWGDILHFLTNPNEPYAHSCGWKNSCSLDNSSPFFVNRSPTFYQADYIVIYHEVSPLSPWNILWYIPINGWFSMIFSYQQFPPFPLHVPITYPFSR